VLHDVSVHYALSVLGMTDDHPSWATGIAPMGEAVFALRQLTRALGWTKEENRGFALTVHPDAKYAVNISKGDLHTGDPEKTPCSHSEKGICTEEALLGNQLSFGFMSNADVPASTVQQVRPTWYLLLRVSGDKILSEFSLPLAMSDEKKISEWAERVILPAIQISQMATSSQDTIDEIVPTVSRKKSING